MKRSILYILAACMIDMGCTKSYNDTINGQTPDQRLSAALAAYQQKLSGSPYGWILTETTTGMANNGGANATGPKAAFAYYMQFNDSNKVTMFSDFDTTMAVIPGRGSYLLKALQRPALIFDTYSYIHVPCDPDPAISKSPFGYGFGWGTDFEFSFSDNIPVAQLGDTIHLTGDLNGASAVMVKATQQQHDAYFGGGLKTTMLTFNQFRNYFKRVSAGGNLLCEMTPSVASNSADINWLDAADRLHSSTTGLCYTPGSIHFATPDTIGTQIFSGLENLSWDPAASVLSATINGSAVTITGAIAPLKNDSTAPYTWWSRSDNSGYFYYSRGFHANGTDDYFGLAKMGRAMVYWADFGGYDLFLSVDYYGDEIGPSVYTPNPPPAVSDSLSTFTPDGRIIFRLDFSNGDPSSIFNKAVATQELDPAGYYLILKEDGTTYDMVGAANATAWIRWTQDW
jgi:Domain of unknown function (DUF4302)